MLGFSQHRSESEAISVALEFWGNKVNRAKLKAVSQSSLNKAKVRVKAKAASTTGSSKQVFYVINDEDHNRFVIVSADERLYKILGYSDNGCFDGETAPDGLLEMMEGYEEQYANVYSFIDEIKQKSKMRSIVEPIEPLIQTRWGQIAPFDLQCPIDKRETDGRRCPVGCVATAMAQVMNYYKYPSQGTGSMSYTTETLRIPQSFDFSATTFNWSLMLDAYNDNASTEQKVEIAKLMHACGISVCMDYGQQKGFSGAAPVNIPYAMINYFGYNPNIVYRHRDYYSSEEWNNFILEELKNGRPLLYGGFNSELKGGHRFILDGCDDKGLYHFNFGWTISGQPDYAGYANGYYSLDVLHAEDIRLSELAAAKGVELDLGDFSYNQSMISNITPHKMGIHEVIFYATNLNIPYTTSKVGKDLFCSFKAECCSSETSTKDTHKPTFQGKVGIGLYDVDFNFIKPLVEKNINCIMYDNVSLSGYVTLDASIFTDHAQYIIAPYAESAKTDSPTRVRAKQGRTEYYLAETRNGEVKLTANGTVTPHEIVTGSYVVSANGGDKTWQIELAKNNSAENSYVISNLDPAVKNINEIYATANVGGNQLTISLNQNIQDNVHLYNQSDPSKIVLTINTTDNTMYTNDTWGSTETSGSGDNVSQKELSRYSNTKITYGALPTPTPILVSNPVITSSPESNIVSILCGTENAKIYYTTDGSNPTQKSTLYSGAFKVSHNCVIKCIAVYGESVSDVVSKNIDWFVMPKPHIFISQNNTVVMECEDKDAIIYFTTDGSDPTHQSSRYEIPRSNTQAITYKAIATKSGFNDSPIVTFVAEGEKLDPLTVAVQSNVAGGLSTKIDNSSKYNIISLTISGELNGTDIKYLRDILQKGKLAKLDISEAKIVSGGEKYYGTYYSTEDNIIGRSMFEDSKSLLNISLPKSITSIESFAFSNCTNLVELTIPSECKSISEFAIPMCYNMENIYVQEGNEYYKSINGILFSADEGTLCKVPVAKDVRHYEIPSNVKKIGSHAFENTNISTLELPSALEEIGSYAFSECYNLVDVVIPNSVNKLGLGAFDACKNLVNVELSTSLEELESFVFSHCVNLKTLFIPKSIHAISGSAFNSCSSLINIDVDNENKHFCSCNSVLYSKDMRSLVLFPIGKHSDEYYVPDGVETISSRAFANCVNIQSVILPSSVIEIGSSAFDNSSLTSINLPNSIEKIGMFAFSSCNSLLSLSLPESISRIEQGLSSYNENLSYLIIPENVNYIGLSAFKGNKSLNVIECWIKNIGAVEFYISNAFPEVESFEGIKEDCTWHVPVGCANVYKAQPWWVSTWKIIDDLVPNPVGINSSSVSKLKVTTGHGTMTFCSPVSSTFDIYNTQGAKVGTVNVEASSEKTIQLNSGIYIVNKAKYVVR